MRQEYYFTDGRIRVRGSQARREKGKKADYLLYYKPNIPLAVIEAKDNKHNLGDGMQQALEYAEILQLPFVFTSNGDGFLFHDRTGQSDKLETELTLDEMPSPEDLWRRYCQWKGMDDWKKDLLAQDFYDDGSGKTPRYYQVNAINRAIEAVGRGESRVLLLMATGTGKTYTAFQIIWRLWKFGIKKRILFLADRNILVDQTKTNDFKPFGNAMTKISGRKIDKSYEIYLALYQAITGPEESRKAFKQFSPDFFDLIIIDECHRGSASEDSEWREILEYFSDATQLGMTATPKETKETSNITYFGEPVYTYSLKQGIEDGFLAPYKVIRVHLDLDVSGWRPTEGMTDKYGRAIEDRIYNSKDWDRNLAMERRRELIASKIVEFLERTDPYAKTIVFCEDIEHAEAMRREISNQSRRAKENSKYVMKITGDDEIGKAELDNFIHPEERYPVIATTSRLMSTGVDAKTCKLIVLDRAINSMIEFKQIIGRGTRVDEEFDKTHFVIMDFRNATDNFADPDFDGEPVVIYEPREDQDILPPDWDSAGDDGPDKGDDYYGERDTDDGECDRPDDIDMPTGPTPPPKKLVVDGVEFKVALERVEHIDENGKLVTESIKDYTRRTVRKSYAELDDFLKNWTQSEKKSEIIAALREEGVFFKELKQTVGRDYDAFDLICHVAFDQPPLTRAERANNVRKRDYFTQYGDAARRVLEALLDKYAEEGIEPIEQMTVLRVPPMDQIGTPHEIIDIFGGKDEYLAAVRQLETALYQAAA